MRISGYSAFNNEISVDDQEFLELINLKLRKRQSLTDNNELPKLKKSSVINNDSLTTTTTPTNLNDNEDKKTFDYQNKNKFTIIDFLPFAQRLLVQNAQKKRIWMNVNSAEGSFFLFLNIYLYINYLIKDCAESRYQKFADTIFWTVKLIFLHQLKNDKNNEKICDNFLLNKSIDSCQNDNLLEKFEDGEINENLIKNQPNGFILLFL